ncbi:alpha/beta fold hydrolase [Paenibacillus nasutitermitis]|uniref:AB hydrolase-1 domain-containing protein n=1 Tax=Paenibacillus nasutitermitis TaxID=1652958 RepID=A0A916Z897_9BACL|nr:alpha/beta hydrolase [Paenibacillus nasutitermitis]GGD79692.1 hypothetical protein GCM10010911_42220 [Paenibacillus nasutitermitis]
MNTEAQIREKIGFVFIYGAGLNRSIWEKVAADLEHPCLLVDFPLRDGSRKPEQGLSLNDYVAYMKKQVEAWQVPKFIIVAHSLGGVPALQLAEEMSERLAGFVAVGASIPRKGGSFLSALPLPKRMLMAVLLRSLGTRPPDAAIRSGLCHDLSAGQGEEIVRNFIPESVRVYTDRVEADVPSVPKLYIKLQKDKEFNEAHQNKMIANFAPQHIASLDTGHLPMLSDPDGLRLALQDFAAKL